MMYPYAKTCGMELTVNVERKGEGKVAPVDLGEESWEEGGNRAKWICLPPFFPDDGHLRQRMPLAAP